MRLFDLGYHKLRDILTDRSPRGLSLLASVHDEVLLRAKPSKVKAAKALLKEAAADAGKRILKSDVPVCLDLGTGKNWWEALQDE